jgi:hypothetical protein
VDLRRFCAAIFVGGVTSIVACAFALPTTACNMSLCGEMCAGSPVCFHFSTTACPTAQCEIVERCHCNGPCSEDVCNGRVNAQECAKNPVCAWGNACTAKRDGCSLLDRATCANVEGCGWEQNCD